MSLSLMSFITLHTYLILIAGTFFYAVLLEAANKHVVREKRLRLFAAGALITALSAWAVKLIALRDYFNGEIGTTSEGVTSSISLFTLGQAYAFPVLIFFGIMLFLIVYKEGQVVLEKPSIRTMVLYLSFLGFALSGLLMFLGVLVP